MPAGVIAALGVSQIIGYGTLYYSFSILAPEMARDFSWPLEWVFGALSLALLAGGFMSPWLGRWIDRFGAGRVMTAGSAMASLSLVICALAPEKYSFVASLVIIELTANFVQYGAAFALLVQIQPQAAQRSITYLTLIAGFASTLFWPITTTLHAHLSWRDVYLVFAGLNLLICMPLHAWLSRRLKRRAKADAHLKAARPVIGCLEPRFRMAGFLAMVTGLSLQSIISSAVLVHMVPLLSGLGLGAKAALVGALFGPAQVASRFTNMVLGKNLSAVNLAIISAAFMAGSVLVLFTLAPSLGGAIGFAVIYGLGSGLFSITNGTLPLMLFGSDGYGQLQGKVLSARLTVSAVAPFAFVVMMRLLGLGGSLLIIALLGLASIASYLAIARMVRSSSAS